MHNNWLRFHNVNILTDDVAKGNLKKIKSFFRNDSYIKNPDILGILLNIASEKGHLDIIKYLIYQRIGDKVSAIQDASRNGHFEVVKYLTSIGVKSYISIQYAAVHGHLEIVKYLVKQHTREEFIKVVDYCIIWASFNDHFEVVKYLMSQGADKAFIKNERCKRYLSFCEKIDQKKRITAQKKIYFWWIQICYDPKTKVGQRMLEKSWVEFDKVQKKN